MSSQRFVATAEAFVTFVDESHARRRDDFVRELERVLIDLYAAGLTLQDTQPDDDSGPRGAVTVDEAAGLQRRLGEKLGNYDFYSVVFDPYDRDSTPVIGSLSDDVTDIYRDLQDGLALFRDGQTANAYWQWKFGFDNHWGRHAAEAIYALYTLRSMI